MKAFNSFLAFAASCTVGLLVYLFLPSVLGRSLPESVIPNRAMEIERDAAAIEAANKSSLQSTENIDIVWNKGDFAKYGNVTVARTCTSHNCSMSLKRNGKLVRRFSVESGQRDWLKFGLFDFLGDGNKQLVVYGYSGGAHCCSDYVIIALQPKFSVLYDSTSLDSGAEVGNGMIPIDIDGDGVFEIRRSV